MAVKSMFQGRASLLDRLIDEEPKNSREVRPLRSLNRKKMKESLRRDLSWLLNTRTPIPGEAFDNRELTVIDYGIPDFGSCSPANPADRALMSRRITRAIRAFEPRLQQVQVTVDPAMPNEKSLQVNIRAMLVIEDVREPISFQTIFHKERSEWDIQ